MRFHYLPIALLAGIAAATVPADSTSTDAKSVALREEHSPSSDGNDIAAVEISAGDEDRMARRSSAKMLTLALFLTDVLLLKDVTRSSAMDGWSVPLNKMVTKTTPEKVYRSIVSFDGGPLLTSMQWRRWAFFASKYCRHFGKNPHEYIVEVMSAHHGAGQLSELLAVEENDQWAATLAKRLQEAQISVWLEHQCTLKQVFYSLQLNYMWKRNIMMSPRYATWIRYLKCVHKTQYEEYPVVTEVLSLWEFIQFDSLLEVLVLSENVDNLKSAEYLQVLKWIGLNSNASPYQIVSMMLKGVENVDDTFTLLFINEQTKFFWMDYVKEFNQQYPLYTTSLCETLRSIFDLPELFIMLHVAVHSQDHERSSMALWYIEAQFSEWKEARVTNIAEIMPDRINEPSEIPPVVAVFWRAYIKYLHESRDKLKSHNTLPNLSLLFSNQDK